MAKDKFKLSLQLVTPPAVIQRRIKEAIANKINLAMKASVKGIRFQVSDVIQHAIADSFEIQSLFGGELQAELGVPNNIARQAVNFIIDAIIQSIQIDIIPMKVFGRGMKGEIRISLLPKDLIKKFGNSVEGSYLTARGQKIPWLKWLLNLGDKIIVRDYDIEYGNSPKSRTGLAVMRRTGRVGWRVPPQYSGTESNNFITRALDDAADFIAFHLRTEFTKQL